MVKRVIPRRRPACLGHRSRACHTRRGRSSTRHSARSTSQSCAPSTPAAPRWSRACLTHRLQLKLNETVACFMLYDFSTGISEVDVNEQTVFGCSDLTVCKKLLNYQLKNWLFSRKWAYGGACSCPAFTSLHPAIPAIWDVCRCALHTHIHIHTCTHTFTCTYTQTHTQVREQATQQPQQQSLLKQQQQKQLQQQVKFLKSIYVYPYMWTCIYAAAPEDFLKAYIHTRTYASQSLYIYIYIYIYICEAAAAETWKTAADVPLRASMPYCARLCWQYLFYMLFWVEPVTWWPMIAIWHGGRCCVGATFSRSRVMAAN